MLSIYTCLVLNLSIHILLIHFFFESAAVPAAGFFYCPGIPPLVDYMPPPGIILDIPLAYCSWPTIDIIESPIFPSKE